MSPKANRSNRTDTDRLRSRPAIAAAIGVSLVAVVVAVVCLLLVVVDVARASDEIPSPLPTMASPVEVSTTFAPPVPLEPTESSALTPTSSAPACDPVALELERARVERLRAKIARLKARR